MVKNTIIFLSVVFNVILYSSNKNLLLDKKIVINSLIAPEVQPYVSQYMNEFKVNSELFPENEFYSLSFSSIRITYTSLIKAAPNQEKTSCKKESRNIYFSAEISKADWDLLNQDQQKYLIYSILNNCLTSKSDNQSSDFI